MIHLHEGMGYLAELRYFACFWKNKRSKRKNKKSHERADLRDED